MPQTSELAGFHGSGLSPRMRNSGGKRVLVRVEEGVDAVGIGLQARLRLGRQSGKATLGEAVEVERADEAVDVEEVRPSDLGDPALADAALDFHLIETLAGVEIAERPRRVVERGREDVGNAVFIAPDARLGLEAGQGDAAGIGGHGAIEEIGAAGEGKDDENDDELRQRPHQTELHISLPLRAGSFGVPRRA